MADFFNFIFVFISTLVSLIALGLLAGFSPTLYIAQIALASKKPKALIHTVALITGVVSALLLLIILFQAIYLDTVLGFVHTTIHALTISVVFNILFGALLIFGGFYYLRHRKLPEVKDEKLKKATGFVGLVGLGFIRTVLSVGGVTATYLAGNVISDVTSEYLEKGVYTLIFLGVAIVPFIAIIILMRKNPRHLNNIVKAVRSLMQQINYRLIIGAGAIIFGSSVIIFNIMIGLFY